MSLREALDKAQSTSPLNGFILCDLLEVVGGFSYYGYQSLSGAWVIKRYEDTTGALRYCAGGTDYPTAWAGRESSTYGLPTEI